MGMMRKIVNVANRLPIIIGDTIQRSSGGLVSAMESLGDSFDMRWVGWAGSHIEEPAKREALSRQIKERFNYSAIFLNPDDAAGYYDGFSNTSMWPLLHYMITYSKYEHEWYRTYKKVNRIFCEAVIEATEPGDIVWIHDYHLMLLPAMLREAGPGRRVGFFLHTPFPSSWVRT
jgi:trehalose 6-phosphate synthase/phosphatase